MKTNSYKFSEPRNTACFTCTHVLKEDSFILYVSHDSEGDWQFLCGADHHEYSQAVVISLQQATELDSSINELHNMPRGVAAERNSLKDRWSPFKLAE
ncbi:MAG: hypothetical protein AB8B53_02070 [Flavobacteriales bacterium]